MKLIIDIPDYNLSDIQNGSIACGQILKAVKNGKPYEEKTQGKWKITDGYPHKVYCDKCYKTYAQENWEVWKDGSLPRNFCPNCGASMTRGGENEEVE